MKKPAHVLHSRAFTLVEIILIVCIIALLAAIALPNFLRARKRAQAVRILDDLRMVDSSLDQYEIEHNKGPGDTVVWADIKPYFKTASSIYNSGGIDLLGGAYNNGTPFSVDYTPKLNTATYQRLSDVAPSDFWSPFYP